MSRKPTPAPVPRSIAYGSSPLLTSATPVWRSRFIVAMLALAFAGLAARAAYVQVIGNDFFQRQGEVRYARTLELPASRGRILDRNGLLNQLLLKLGLIDAPLQILYTPTAAYIGIVYCYLPFMVLPLYANLVKLDNRLLEAAYDLGAKPWQAFLRITLPLSRTGIIAGCMLVMIPAVGEFVIPEMLGGPDTLMIGRVLWGEFFNNRDWPTASAVAIVMLALLLVPILLFNRMQQRELEGKLA